MILQNYHHFAGRHWETGSVCNDYAYKGITAPHTGQPYSEAFLLGVSGGIVTGYFSFAYEGFDPHVALLTRNTFEPLDRLFERLGVDQEARQTSNPQKAVRNLLDTLESGVPAITWADVMSLPYNAAPDSLHWWQMYPIVVYGYDEAADCVYIADRARVPLTVTTAELAAARGRVKIDKYRILTPSPPDPTKLPAAVTKGIWDTIRLYTDAPPRGSKENFGFAAYRRWRELLTNPKPKSSWARVFPPGRKFVCGLETAFEWIIRNGEDGGGERRTYAAFLDEAAILLDKPALRETADYFRAAASEWDALGLALLPDTIEPFRLLRQAVTNRHNLFLDKGGAFVDELRRLDAQIESIRAQSETNFPLDDAALRAFTEALVAQISRLHDVEQTAVKALQEAMVGGVAQP